MFVGCYPIDLPLSPEPIQIPFLYIKPPEALTRHHVV